jgi:DNA topoisomerase-3
MVFFIFVGVVCVCFCFHMVLTALFVAEKPSIANSLATVLSGGRGTPSQRGGRLPVYDGIQTRLNGQPYTAKITSVAGHVFSLDFPGEYQNWDAVDPVRLFSANTVKQECSGHVRSHLQHEAIGCDAVVLFLDCDMEGENICFEVLDCIAGKMNKGFKTFRAKFSSVTAADLQKALTNLGAPNKVLPLHSLFFFFSFFFPPPC